ncbi:MAG: hypothetical protein E6J14_00385 [Chloroflexi bacterium]|nr:MAG: hypothetical protein E6J14_00385 [Chloroflexota bacterium]
MNTAVSLPLVLVGLVVLCFSIAAIVDLVGADDLSHARRLGLGALLVVLLPVGLVVWAVVRGPRVSRLLTAAVAVAVLALLTLIVVAGATAHDPSTVVSGG